MLKKRFFKTKQTCQVTFELPTKEVEAKKVNLAGDFNGWDITATPLRKVKNVWKTSLKLEQGQEYQFRYIVDGNEWLNDKAADKYVPNNINGENSVVVTSQN